MIPIPAPEPIEYAEYEAIPGALTNDVNSIAAGVDAVLN